MRAQLEQALQSASLSQVHRDEGAMELGRSAWALCDAATAGALSAAGQAAAWTPVRHLDCMGLPQSSPRN